MKKIIVANCLDYPTTPNKIYITPHVCNDIGGWGSGFVVAISEKYSEPSKFYRKWHKDKIFHQFSKDVPFELGEVQFVNVEKHVIIANMIAQHNTIKNSIKPIRYRHLANCMHTVGVFCKKYKNHINALLTKNDKQAIDNPVEIRCPLFGAGLAGGKWEIIDALIDELWITEFDIPVTICVLTQQDNPND